MAEIVTEKVDLCTIAAREVDQYAGNSIGEKLYALLDEKNQRYTVIAIPDNAAERPAAVALMARVVGDLVIIEEDTFIDKPLYEALMVNGGLPREKIVLAYKGETVPQTRA